MFYYARSDTHFLLYIYDMVRNELVERSDRDNPESDLIETVIQKSKEVSLQRYENPISDPDSGLGPRGWYNTLLKSPTLYDSEQFAVYKAVHKWRDDTARRKDESPFFIMTQQVLADIARVLPADQKALWSLLDSNARGLKVHLGELFDLIQAARARGLHGPKMVDVFRANSGEPAKAGVGIRQSHAVIEVGTDDLKIRDLRSKRSQLWGDLPLSSV